MRYPASEKLEIIRTVEGSHLPVKQTLDMLGIPLTTFYRWYDRFVEGVTFFWMRGWASGNSCPASTAFVIDPRNIRRRTSPSVNNSASCFAS